MSSTILAVRKNRRGRLPGRQSPSFIKRRKEIRPAVLLSILRQKIAALPDHVLLAQVGGPDGAYLAVDADAQIVATAFRSSLQCSECEGVPVQVCWVSDDDIDAALEAILTAGHHVAIAVAVEEADENGLARTAVVRRMRHDSPARRRIDDTTEDPEKPTDFGLALLARLERMHLPPEVQEVARKAIWGWLDALASRHVESKWKVLHADSPGRPPIDWEFLADIAQACAGLRNDNQTRVINMIHRFRELAPGEAVAGDFDWSDENARAIERNRSESELRIATFQEDSDRAD